MKYLLKFVIETWSYFPGSTKEENLILKVEFDEEIAKKNGLFSMKPNHHYSTQSYRFKSCEKIEGPEEVHSLMHKKLLFKFRRQEFPDCVAVDLEMYGDDLIEIRYMGSEPIPDEEPQTISSPGE